MAQDPVLAAQWYRKAAEQGHLSAMTHLGQCYQDGLGVPKYLVEALKWFLLAASEGAPMQLLIKPLQG